LHPRIDNRIEFREVTFMNLVDSSDRTPADFFFFAVNVFGNIIATIGVVTSTVAVAVLGLLMMAFAIGYFLLTEE
jgi:hypothetical protein